MIHILVDLSANRGILQERNIYDPGNIKGEAQNRGKGRKSTWKRIQGKENVIKLDKDSRRGVVSKEG